MSILKSLGPIGKLDGLMKAMRQGCFIHAFLSGGGLRVVRVETRRGNNMKGYGEHPSIEDALMHADEDFLAGGRKYEKVYGHKYPHYLTGSSSPSSKLDQWLLKGSSFDCWMDGDDEYIVCRLKGYGKTELPDGMQERILKTGKKERWESRGYTYEACRSSFPSGEPCISTSVAKSPPGRNGADPWMYQVTKTGRGSLLKDAVKSALSAPDTETSQAEAESTRPVFDKT